MNTKKAAGIIAALLGVSACVAADGNWLKHVPEKDRNRVNPMASKADAVAAGQRMFGDHCAKCHGEDAAGNGKKPSLRSARVQRATDGELFWLLKNGNLPKGMPTWAGMPEPMRWQIITFIKSLESASQAVAGKKSNGMKL